MVICMSEMTLIRVSMVRIRVGFKISRVRITVSFRVSNKVKHRPMLTAITAIFGYANSL